MTPMVLSASTVQQIGHHLQYLIDKRLVHEVRPPDAEIQDVNPLHDGVVKGVQEPGGVGHLAVGEHAVHVQLRVRGKPQALLYRTAWVAHFF